MAKKAIKDWNRSEVINFLKESKATKTDVKTIIELFKTNKNIAQIDPNIGGKDGTHMLTKAAIIGSESLTELAIKHGANIDLFDESGTNALHNACRYGNVEVVRLLLEKGANVNCETTKAKFTTISFVYEQQEKNFSEYSEIVKLLIKYKANVNVPYKGASALMYTCRFEDYETTKMLIDNGADVNYKCKDDTVWSVTGSDDIKLLLLKSKKLSPQIENMNYKIIQFKICFEEKCEKDIEALKSDKVFFWDLLVKMLTYYTIGYTRNNPEYKNKVGDDDDGFFAIKSYGVKIAIEKYMTNNWFLSRLHCKDSRVIEVKNAQEKVIKIFVPKIIWYEIGKFLFADVVEKILEKNTQDFQLNRDPEDDVIGDLFDD